MTNESELTKHAASGWTNHDRLTLSDYEGFLAYTSGNPSIRSLVTHRWSCRDVANCVMNPYWLGFQVILVFVDLVLYAFFEVPHWFAHEHAICTSYSIWLWIIALVSTTDFVLNVFAFGVSYFSCCRLVRIADVLAIIAIDLSVVFSSIADIEAIRILRAVRLLRYWGRGASGQYCACLRSLVSKNKKRYIDPLENFDLDLTYIMEPETDLIAMGVPASNSCGLNSDWCRNPVSEVARFFEEKHAERYIIVNCCPELPYPTEEFKTGYVYPMYVPDKHPPTLKQFLEYLDEVSAFKKSSDDVVAVHCKAGMGRTGSLIVAWLMKQKHPRIVDAARGAGIMEIDESGEKFSKTAMNWFAHRRTNFYKLGCCCPGGIMGVETPSQKRYLMEYLNQVFEDQGLENQIRNLDCERNKRQLCGIQFHVGNEKLFARPERRQLVIVVHYFDAKYITQNPWKVLWVSEKIRPVDAYRFDCKRKPLDIANDVRISIFDAHRFNEIDVYNDSRCWRSADGEKGLLLYFVLHAHFLPRGHPFELRREDIDLAHANTPTNLLTYNRDGGGVTLEIQ